MILKEGNIIEIKQYRHDGLFVTERWIAAIIVQMYHSQMLVKPLNKTLWPKEPPELYLPLDQQGHMWR
jgi:protein associated with RNAse G/E